MRLPWSDDPFHISNSPPEILHKGRLEWEESAIDNNRSTDEIFDHERREPTFRMLSFFVVLVFFLFLGRVMYLQIFKGTEFRNLSENNRIRKQVLLAPRGIIYDAYNEILAQSRAGLNLVVVPFDLSLEGVDEQLTKLSAFVDINIANVQQIIANANRQSLQPIVIIQNVTPEQAILFETRASEFIGFSIQTVPIRDYLNSKIFAHILGFTGLISQNDLAGLDKQKYDFSDYIGKSGIEQAYESYLHGINGNNLVEIDATGKLLNVLGQSPAKPGSSLFLSIDKQLQVKIYESLSARGGSTRKAAAVALNPKTGEVLALLSLPTFDNNLFAQGISAKQYQQIIENPNLPLFNRSIAGTYPPGSTVKPIVAAAALNEGIVNEKTEIVDRGVLVIPNQYDPKISYNFYGWKRDGLGVMNVRSAIAQSSDIYFYTITGGHPNSSIQGLGAEKLAEYYRKFNLGKLTGIDIPGEKPGLVADPKWKAEYFKHDPVLKAWYLGDTYHIGIGQGDMLATPLQVAEWTAVIANNGIGFKPQIVKAIKNLEGDIVWENKPQILVGKFLNNDILKIIQEGMRETVISGSGRQLSNLSQAVAGKTGTSQFDGSDPSRTHAWFTAYAPLESPEIVITVLVEAGGEGYVVAVPVVKDVLEWWITNRYQSK